MVFGFRSSGCDLFRWVCGGWVTMKAIAWWRGMEVGNSVVKSALKVCLSTKRRAHSPWGFFPLKRGTHIRKGWHSLSRFIMYDIGVIFSRCPLS